MKKSIITILLIIFVAFNQQELCAQTCGTRPSEHLLWSEAETFGVMVFAIDYRVAPKHKFPAAVNDSYNAFKWLTEHGSEFSGDSSRIAY